MQSLAWPWLDSLHWMPLYREFSTAPQPPTAETSRAQARPPTLFSRTTVLGRQCFQPMPLLWVAKWRKSHSEIISVPCKLLSLLCRFWSVPLTNTVKNDLQFLNWCISSFFLSFWGSPPRKANQTIKKSASPRLKTQRFQLSTFTSCTISGQCLSGNSWVISWPSSC